MARHDEEIKIILSADDNASPHLKKAGGAFLDLSSIVSGFAGGGAFALISKGFDLIGNAIGGVINVAKSLGTALLNLGKESIKSAANLEQQRIGLTTLLGTTEAANDAINAMKEDAKKTPFELTGLIDMNKRLISAGISAGDSRKIIMNLGDAVSAVGGSQDTLDRLVNNFQQIKATGKAATIDIKQFAFAGIPIYDMLAESMGKSKDKISEMIEEGKIGFPQIEAAFAGAASKGGRFFEAMSDQAGSFNGILSNIKDTIGIMLTEFAEQSGLFDLVKGAGDKLLGILTQVKDAATLGMDKFKEWAGIIITELQPQIENLRLNFLDLKQKIIDAWNVISNNEVIRDAISKLGKELINSVIFTITVAIRLLRDFFEWVKNHPQEVATMIHVLIIVAQQIKTIASLTDWTIRKVADLISLFAKLTGISKSGEKFYKDLGTKAGDLGGVHGFQQGGIVNGRPGDGTTIRASDGEMVLNKNEQQNLFKMIKSGQGASGSGATINIGVNIPFYTGDPATKRKVAEEIWEELKRISQSNGNNLLLG